MSSCLLASTLEMRDGSVRLMNVLNEFDVKSVKTNVRSEYNMFQKEHASQYYEIKFGGFGTQY